MCKNKRLDVSIKTLRRFSANAEAFFKKAETPFFVVLLCVSLEKWVRQEAGSVRFDLPDVKKDCPCFGAEKRVVADIYK